VDEDAPNMTIPLANVFADVEGDALTLSVSSTDISLVTANISGSDLILDFQDNYDFPSTGTNSEGVTMNASGTAVIRVTATENADQTKTVSTEFTVTVDPVWAGLGPAQERGTMYAILGGTFNLTPELIPNIQVQLQWQLSQGTTDENYDNVAGGGVVPAGNLMGSPASYTIASDQSQVDHFIRCQITATYGDNRELTFISPAIKIENVNDAPTGAITMETVNGLRIDNWDGTGPLPVFEGATVRVNTSGIVDPDGDSMTFHYYWVTSYDHVNGFQDTAPGLGIARWSGDDVKQLQVLAYQLHLAVEL
jgi:hypothetical protein